MGKKANSRERILEAAGRLFRAKGIEAVSIAEVMQESGMTHGGFYAHFKSKADLQAAALTHMAAKQREIWFAALEGMDPATMLSSLTARYLNPSHRDHPESGCPYVALAADAAHASADAAHATADAVNPDGQNSAVKNSGPLSRDFAHELDITLNRLISSGAVADRDGALSYLSLCVGGLLLSRAVGEAGPHASPDSAPGNLADDFIRATRAASLRVLARPD